MATTSLPGGQEVPLRLRLWLETAGLLRLVMIAMWAAAWYPMLTGGRTSWINSFLMLMLVLAVSFYLVRFSSRLGFQPGRARAAFAFWLAAALFFSVRSLANSPIPEGTARTLIAPDIGIFVHLVIILLVAWRGLALAQSPLDVGETSRSFQVGTAALLLYGLMFGSRLSGTAFLPVYAYLWVSLVALAVARITDLSFMRGGRLPGSLKTWGLPIAAAAAAAVLISMLLGYAVSQQVGSLTVFFIGAFFLLVVLVSAVVAAPVLLIIYLISPWLQDRFSEGLEQMPLQNPQVLADQIFGDELQRITDATTGVDQVYILVMAAVLLAIFIFILVNYRRRGYARQVARTGDSVEALVPGIPTGNPVIGYSPGRRWSRAGRLLAAARIRRIYTQLMDLSASLGAPRPAALTPLEFLPHIATIFPGREDELSQITAAYLKVRYGELPEDETELQRIVSAWERVRSNGRSAMARLRREKRS